MHKDVQRRTGFHINDNVPRDDLSISTFSFFFIHSFLFFLFFFIYFFFVSFPRGDGSKASVQRNYKFFWGAKLPQTFGKLENRFIPTTYIVRNVDDVRIKSAWEEIRLGISKSGIVQSNKKKNTKKLLRKPEVDRSIRLLGTNYWDIQLHSLPDSREWRSTVGPRFLYPHSRP